MVQNQLKQQINRRLLLMLVSFFSMSTSISACSCIGEASIKDALSFSDIIFFGRVLSKTTFTVRDTTLFPTKDSVYSICMPFDMAKYSVRVYSLYKGETKSDTIELITGMGHGDCGVEFDIGRQYLIYANYHDRYLQESKPIERFIFTDICTRTKQIVSTKDRRELLYLKKHKKG